MMEQEKDSTAPSSTTARELSDRARVIEELENRERISAQQLTMRRLLFVGSLSLLLVGAFFWLQTTFVAELFTYDRFSETDRQDRRLASNVRLFGSFFILISTAVFAYLFMVGFDPRKSRVKLLGPASDENAAVDNLVIISLLKSIDKSIEKGKLESVLSSHERSEIIGKIAETVESQLNDSLLARIDDKYGLAVRNDKLAGQTTASLNTTIDRLRRYADNTQAKASVNLAYGIAATIGAITVLIFVLVNAAPPANATLIDVVFYYSSRLFLVILVQGISIFFLNLYRATLESILYLNNEITNHEAKRDSLALAFNSDNKEAIASLLVSLSQTERNFSLKKGETSIFGKAELQQNAGAELLAVLKELLAKTSSKPS